MTIHVLPATSDFGRLEDIAAAALQAGRRVAGGLRRLDLGTTTRAARLGHLVALLTSERLFEPLGLSEITELEAELHVLVEREAYYVPAFGAQDAEEEIRPDRRLTEAGLIIEEVRSNLAEALHLARYTLDLATAERVVGRARGLLGT